MSDETRQTRLIRNTDDAVSQQLPLKMNGKIQMEDKLHPGNQLAVARTVLANRRTLLAIFRTALGCFIGGASLLKFFGHPVYEIVGIFLMIIAAVILGVGLRKYWTIKKLIGAIDPEDWQALEAMVEKN